MIKALKNHINKFLFNILNELCPSSILRSCIYKVFGAVIGKGVKIEKILIMNYDGNNLNNLILNKKVFIGTGTIIDIKEKVIVGESTKIASGCNISTHVDCGSENRIFKLYSNKIEKVVIGNNTWIGVNSTILCGVIIGDNSIIGALSLVRNNIPSKVLAFGIPAKIQKKLDTL